MPGFHLVPPSQTPLLQPAPAPPANHSTSHYPLSPPLPRPLPAFHTNSSMIPTQTSVRPILSKQVTDPLPATPHARIHATPVTNYSSSGSTHDPTSVCLAEMVHDFLEEEAHVESCGRARCNCLNGTCGGEEAASSEADCPLLPADQLSDSLEELISCTISDKPSLLVDVTKAIEAKAEKRPDESLKDNGYVASRGCFRRPVMKHLRQFGYNAAICKTKWSHADDIPAGDYEFIDVLMEGDSEKLTRYIVDIDFKAQFEIARASKQYRDLLEVLPVIFVGRTDTLKRILKIMSRAAKRSLKKENLLLPPWRKQQYMHAKWFSSYRRTTNEESQKSKKLEPHEFLALRTPRFCLEFTKEMDMFPFRPQSKASQGDLHFGIRDESLELSGICRAANGVVTGLEKNPKKVWMEPRKICAGTSTGWQLPSQNERRVDSCRDRISGLAKALEEAGICSAAGRPKQLEEPKTFTTKRRMLVAVS